MRSVLCGLLLFSFSLLGQSAREDKATLSKLTSTLTALQNVGANRASLTQQLVDVMMSLAEGDRRPSRPTVEGFADEFIGALIGRNLTNAQVAMLHHSITEVLRGSTTNLKSASDLREALTALRVDSSKTRVIIKHFLAIGEEIRGPDDSPVKAVNDK